MSHNLIAWQKPSSKLCW